jgi:hypothetical protein
MRNAYKMLVGKPGGKRPLGRRRRRWEDNIKMDVRNTLVPMAERSEERTVFGRSNIGIVGSNPTRGMDVCPRFFFF